MRRVATVENSIVAAATVMTIFRCFRGLKSTAKFFQPLRDKIK